MTIITPLRHSRRAIAAATTALGLAAPATAAAASPAGYPNPTDAGGLATEIASSHGALAWFTTPDGRPSSASTTLHLRTPEATNTVAVRTDRRLARLSLGTDARGVPVVLAVAHDGEIPGTQGGLRDPDVVRIDVATGAVSPLPAGAKRGVAESAASVDAGRVVLGRRAGSGRAALYQATLTGSRVTRLRSTSGLTPTSRANVTDVAVSPAAGERPTFAFRTQDVGRTDFTQEDLYTARGTHTPSRAGGSLSSGANFESVAGASWESPTRLWFAVSAEDNPSVLHRWSTLTKRASSRPSDPLTTDTAWRSAADGVVATVQGPDQARLHASGPVGG